MATPEEGFTVPEQMTEAGLVFFFTSDQARNFAIEFIRTAQANDFLMFASLRSIFREGDGTNFSEFRANVAENRSEYEEDGRPWGITPEELDQALENPDRAALLLLRSRRDSKAIVKDHRQFLIQTVLARIYAAFQIYVVDLVAQIFHAAPPTPEELGTKTLEEHIDFISRRKDMLYKDVYRKRLNLPLFSNEAERNTEVLIAETRHIIEHNRGRISQQFVRNVQNFTKYTPADVGRPIALDIKQIVENVLFPHNKVKDIEARAIAQFGLRTVSPSTPDVVKDKVVVPQFDAGAESMP
jgi:hypothetical protein